MVFKNQQLVSYPKHLQKLLSEAQEGRFVKIPSSLLVIIYAYSEHYQKAHDQAFMLEDVVILLMSIGADNMTKEINELKAIAKLKAFNEEEDQIN